MTESESSSDRKVVATCVSCKAKEAMVFVKEGIKNRPNGCWMLPDGWIRAPVTSQRFFLQNDGSRIVEPGPATWISYYLCPQCAGKNHSACR